MLGEVLRGTKKGDEVNVVLRGPEKDEGRGVEGVAEKVLREVLKKKLLGC